MSWKKNREMISYLIIGVLTTLVYFVVRFSVFSLTNSGLFSVVTAQILSILFAFFTNKWLVFQNHAKGWQDLLQQFFLFSLARGFVFLLDIGITLLTVELYATNLIEFLRLDQINYHLFPFSWGILKSFIGNPVNLNAFIFAFLTQVCAIVINYILSKYVVFKKKTKKERIA
ncbi:GtrA family protein [Enterococcus sp. LJL98]